MKKTLSLLLAVLLMLGCMTFTAAAGQTAPEEDFEIDPNGVITLYWGIDSDLVIPATINDVPVTAIAGSMYDSNGVFSWNSRLTSVTIPEGVVSIGDFAFFYCENVSSVTIPGTVTSIGKGAFNSCDFSSVTIPKSVTSISDYAFGYLNSLTSVTVNWTNLNNIEIAEDAFDGVDLSNVTLYVPTGTESLYSDRTVFQNFKAIVPEFEFSNGVITKYNGPGGDVVIPAAIGGAAVTAIGYGAFAWGDPMDMVYQNTSLTSVTIPDSVTSIGDFAFLSCVNLSSVTIPEGVVSIGFQAFGFCDSLSSVTIPDGVTSIGAYAFSYCESLSSVTIPKTVTSIVKYTFQWCTGLTSMTVNWTNPNNIEITENAFDRVDPSNVTLYVPAGTKSLYSDHAVWGQFYDIEELPPEGVSVTLTPSAKEIKAGETVTITVTAEGAQNCADIKLTYNKDVFDYTSATVSNVTVPETPDGTLRILTEDTKNPINVLTFTSKDTLTEDTTADFKFEFAKFADTESAMTADAVEAATKTETSVKVISNKHTVTFNVNGETKTQDYVGKEQTILAEHIPTNPTKDGYTFVGWSYDTNTYTTDQLTGMAVTANVTYTAVFALDVTVTVQADYVHGTEATSYTKIIVTGDLAGYTYNGNAMYKVADKTFAYIVPTTADLTSETGVEYATGLVAASDTAAVDISVTDTKDVNATGKVDIADARAVYNCANNLVDLDNYMAVYIRADVNNSGAVEANDTAAVISAIKTAGTVNANA